MHTLFLVRQPERIGHLELQRVGQHLVSHWVHGVAGEKPVPVGSVNKHVIKLADSEQFPPRKRGLPVGVVLHLLDR